MNVTLAVCPKQGHAEYTFKSKASFAWEQRDYTFIHPAQNLVGGPQPDCKIQRTFAVSLGFVSVGVQRQLAGHLGMLNF